MIDSPVRRCILFQFLMSVTSQTSQTSVIHKDGVQFFGLLVLPAPVSFRSPWLLPDRRCPPHTSAVRVQVCLLLSLKCLCVSAWRLQEQRVAVLMRVVEPDLLRLQVPHPQFQPSSQRSSSAAFLQLCALLCHLLKMETKTGFRSKE